MQKNTVVHAGDQCIDDAHQDNHCTNYHFHLLSCTPNGAGQWNCTHDLDAPLSATRTPLQVLDTAGRRLAYSPARIAGDLRAAGMPASTAEAHAASVTDAIRASRREVVSTDSLRTAIGEIVANPKAPNVQRIFATHDLDGTIAGDATAKGPKTLPIKDKIRIPLTICTPSTFPAPDFDGEHKQCYQFEWDETNKPGVKSVDITWTNRDGTTTTETIYPPPATQDHPTTTKCRCNDDIQSATLHAQGDNAGDRASVWRKLC